MRSALHDPFGRTGRHTRGGRQCDVAAGSNIVTAFPATFDAAARIGAALGVIAPHTLLRGQKFMAVWDDPGIIRGMQGPGAIAPVLEALGFWGLIATAPGDAAI